MPKLGAAGTQLIQSFEGCVLYCYDDADEHMPHPRIMPGDHVEGVLTIGWGHTGNDVHPGMIIDQQQADMLFELDIQKFVNAVQNFAKVVLNQNQFDALVSFDYNTGSLSSSTLGNLVNMSEFAAAADQFGRWIKDSTGQDNAGLIRRRAAEKALFLKPTK